MKNLVAIVMLTVVQCLTAQSDEFDRQFGFAMNMNLSYAVLNPSIAPTFIYYKNKQQLEIGIPLRPGSFRHPRVLGVDVNYKIYPNGIENNFDLYFLTTIQYANAYWDKTSYIDPHIVSANSLSFLGGYGFQIRFAKNTYLGLDLSAGINSMSRKSTSSSYPENTKLFDSFQFDAAIQLGFGYRF